MKWGVGSSFSVVGHCDRDGFMAKLVSGFTNLFDVGIFLIHSKYRSCSVSGFLFMVIAPCVVTHSVCSWEKGS